MLTALGAWGRRWAASTTPWTNVYGVGRTLLAMGSLITLVLTPARELILPAAGVDRVPVCFGATKLGMFCLAPPNHLEWARYAAIACLLLVASGWRPRYTAILHWWVALTIQDNIIVVDGGDQATLVLATLLLPIALTDRRKWHWQTELPATASPSTMDDIRRLVALVAMMLIRVQVAAIYFHAAVGKFGVEEWGDGTAIWYFVTDPMLGATHAVTSVLAPMFRIGLVVTTVTWGVLALECVLTVGLLLDRKYRGKLLVFGIFLHAGIILLFGLVSFAFAMFGALVLYLRPFDAPFNLPALAFWRLRRRSSVAEAPLDPEPMSIRA